MPKSYNKNDKSTKPASTQSRGEGGFLSLYPTFKAVGDRAPTGMVKFAIKKIMNNLSGIVLPAEKEVKIIYDRLSLTPRLDSCQWQSKYLGESASRRMVK